MISVMIQADGHAPTDGNLHVDAAFGLRSGVGRFDWLPDYAGDLLGDCFADSIASK